MWPCIYVTCEREGVGEVEWIYPRVWWKNKCIYTRTFVYELPAKGGEGAGEVEWRYPRVWWKNKCIHTRTYTKYLVYTYQVVLKFIGGMYIFVPKNCSLDLDHPSSLWRTALTGNIVVVWSLVSILHGHYVAGVIDTFCVNRDRCPVLLLWVFYFFSKYFLLSFLLRVLFFNHHF